MSWPEREMSLNGGRVGFTTRCVPNRTTRRSRPKSGLHGAALKEARGHETALRAKADSTTKPQWLLTKGSHVGMFLGDAPVSFLLESGIGDHRPPAMGTEDYQGKGASIVRRDLLLIRNRAWVMTDRPCRPGLELRHLPSGITEGRPAGEERFPLVVAASRTIALAHCARPRLRVVRGPCCDHRPSVDAESDRRRATSTQPAMGAGVGGWNRALLLWPLRILCYGVARQFLHFPILCPRPTRGAPRSDESAFGRLSRADADR